jgi:hypothetical protein
MHDPMNSRDWDGWVRIARERRRMYGLTEDQDPFDPRNYAYKKIVYCKGCGERHPDHEHTSTWAP